jgi:hypothetical protein
MSSRTTRAVYTSKPSPRCPIERKLEADDWRRRLQDATLQLLRRLPSASASALPSAEQLALVAGWLDTNVCPSADLFRLVQARLRTTLVTLVNEERARFAMSDAALLGLGVHVASATADGPAETPAGCVRRPALVREGMMAGGRRKRIHDDDDADGQDGTSKRARTLAPEAATVVAACFAPLEVEVRALAGKIAKVAGVHLRVYSGWYAALLEGGEVPALAPARGRGA